MRSRDGLVCTVEDVLDQFHLAHLLELVTVPERAHATSVLVVSVLVPCLGAVHAPVVCVREHLDCALDSRLELTVQSPAPNP